MSHGVQLSGNEMLNRKVLSLRRKVKMMITTTMMMMMMMMNDDDDFLVHVLSDLAGERSEERSCSQEDR